MAAVPGAVTPGAVADSADPAPFGAGLWRLVAALVGRGRRKPWPSLPRSAAVAHRHDGAGAGRHRAGRPQHLQEGFAALRAGRLNINALMTVAVTGAFVIGQWPERRW